MSRTCKCPLCGEESKLDSCDEVDIGIGVITGNELWDCPDHGRWAVNDRVLERLSHSFSFIDMEMTLLRPFPVTKIQTNSLYGKIGRPVT